jgi:7-keto-8-aminopelargonate synthetase-like enzyme
MGTLGKAIGAAGGFIAGSRALIDLLVNQARSFIFSTAPTPATAAAARAGVALLQTEEGRDRRARLLARVDEAKAGLAKNGWNFDAVRGPIVPLVIGDEGLAVATANSLRERGVLLPAIRFPTVARGEARLRLSLTAGHTAKDVAELLAAIASARIMPMAAK